MFTGFLIALFLVVIVLSVVITLSVVSRKSDSPTVTVHADDTRSPLHAMPKQYRMTYHNKDGYGKRWEVRNSNGDVVYTFTYKPTEDAVTAAGFDRGTSIAVAAANYRARVNDRCSDKGKRLRYED